MNFYELVDTGVLLHIKVTPNSSSSKILGILKDGFLSSLKISIVAIPEKGKANKELIDFLSKLFLIRKSSIEIEKGSISQKKLVKLTGDPYELEQKIKAVTI